MSTPTSRASSGPRRSTGWLLIAGSLLLIAIGVLGAALGPGPAGWWLLPALVGCLPFGAGVVFASGRSNPLALFLAAGAALFATYGLAGLVPALALDQAGERVSCVVHRQQADPGGRGTYHYRYLVRCPDGQRLEFENAATTRELDRRPHPVGAEVEVLRTPEAGWAPDTAESVDRVLGSWYRWASVGTLAAALLWTLTRSVRAPAPPTLPPTHH